MAITRILSDWVTLQGDGVGITGATQSQAEYLDLAGASDLVFYLILANATLPATGGGHLALESAPDNNDALFVSLRRWDLVNVQGDLSEAQLGTNVAVVPFAANPASRWLRWNIFGYTVAWSITMRIFVAINPSNYAPALVVREEAAAARELFGPPERAAYRRQIGTKERTHGAH